MHMKLSKSDFNGTGKVYRFTLAQMVKGKANIITMLVFFSVCGFEYSDYDSGDGRREDCVFG